MAERRYGQEQAPRVDPPPRPDRPPASPPPSSGRGQHLDPAGAAAVPAPSSSEPPTLATGVQEQLRLARIEIEQRGTAVNQLISERDDARTALTVAQHWHRIELRLERDAQVQLRRRLIAAEAGRDEALAKRDQMVENASAWKRQWDLARAELASWRGHSKTPFAETRRLEALIVERSNRVVARSGGRDCIRCGQDIRRGEASVYLDPDNAPDDLAHARCPDVGDRPTYLPGSTVRTRDADGNDFEWLIDEMGRPTPVTEGLHT